MAVAHKYFVVCGYSVKVLGQAQTHAFVVAGKFMLLRKMMIMEMIVKFRMKDFRENFGKIDSTLIHRKEKNI